MPGSGGNTRPWPGIEEVFPPGIPTSTSAVATSGRAPVARSSSLGPG